MSKKYSLLDSEMKEWEHKYRRVIDPSEYVILRIDGRAFHTFTRGLDKPFDSNLKDSMVYTSEALAKGIQGVRPLLRMSKNTHAFPGRDPYDTADKWVNDLHTHGTSLVKYSQISSNELNINEEDLENARLALAWVGQYLPMLWD